MENVIVNNFENMLYLIKLCRILGDYYFGPLCVLYNTHYNRHNPKQSHFVKISTSNIIVTLTVIISLRLGAYLRADSFKL